MPAVPSRHSSFGIWYACCGLVHGGAVASVFGSMTARCNSAGIVSKLCGGLSAHCQKRSNASTHGSIKLEQIVRAELEAHGASEAVEIGGPDVELAPNAAQALALALHELATNAVKYGALRQRSGTLKVMWDLRENDRGRLVQLEWRETGLSLPTDAPVRRGYGRELIERALPYQLDAVTNFEIAADGVRCSVELPLGRTK
jgi:two-component sensor histidine kinase